MGDDYDTMDKPELIALVVELKGIIEKMRNELEKYKNSNTPPSSNKHLKQNTNGNRSKNGAKRGAPLGHIGQTRKQIPDSKKDVDADFCPKCNSPNITDKKVHVCVVDDVPEPQKPKTIHAEIHEKKCLDCGNIFIPQDNTIPLKGKFGINLMVLLFS